MVHFEHDRGISDYLSLKMRIMHLNALREEKEDQIAHNFKELYYTAINPKNWLRGLVSSGDTESPMGGIAKLGLGFVIQKIFRGMGIKGYLASLAFEKVAGYAVNHPSILSSGVIMLKNLFTRKKSEEEQPV